MALNQIDVVWAGPDGGETEIDSNVLRIQVADGLWIRVAFGRQESRQITAQLTFHDEQGREEANAVRGRFVIIPINESSALLGVAMASESPADLIPIRSKPVWTTLEGAPMPTSQGIITARAVGGVGLTIGFAAGPGDKDACVLHISSLSEDRTRSEDERAHTILSVPRVSPEAVTISAG